MIANVFTSKEKPDLRYTSTGVGFSMKHDNECSNIESATMTYPPDPSKGNRAERRAYAKRMRATRI